MAKKRITRSKRKTSTRKRKGSGSITSLFTLLKQTGKWGIILFVSMIAILYLVDFLQKDHPGLFRKDTNEGIDMPGTPPPTSAKTTVFRMPEGGEIPKLTVRRKEQIIEHEGYVVSYNSTYKIANWVAYELTDEEVRNKNVERSNKFVPDPLVKGATAVSSDYSNTGFDRGHLAPAGDMRWSEKAMRESFYLSNICPQHPQLNRGIWKKLEEQVRVWALEHEAVYIATGPVIEPGLRVIGKNEVAVPEYFYKVIGIVADNRPVGIGFLFENKDYKKTTLKSMVIPIDSVEKVTGIDFFYQLPKDLQEQMESQVEWKYWTF
ncbi:MAG: DNA/RNA non-specific endonuclease [Tannerellaceae bacterium]|nr:DNA/RNA non-specific endonuclease [Tannerellaceae bacterium]